MRDLTARVLGHPQRSGWAEACRPRDQRSFVYTSERHLIAVNGLRGGPVMSDAKTPKKSTGKDSQLVIRIKQSERDAFVSLCKDQDTSAAREIRRFIRRFLAETGKDG